MHKAATNKMVTDIKTHQLIRAESFLRKYCDILFNMGSVTIQESYTAFLFRLQRYDFFPNYTTK